MVPDRKPRGYWYVILALGLNVACGLGQAQEQTDGGESAAPTQEQPPPSLPLPFPVEIVEDYESAEARKRREAEAVQREKDDLVAQQGMNSATQAMNDATQKTAFYSLLSTLLVAIGTALLIWTLFLTRQANKAARDAVVITQKVGERQVRAYVNFQYIRLWICCLVA